MTYVRSLRRTALSLRALVLGVLLATPSLALAVDGTFLIPSWQDPSQSALYGFNTNIIVNATWQLPPKWVGNIYAYIDAEVDLNTGQIISEGTKAVNLSTGLDYYAITNAAGNATTSGALSMNIGPLPDGSHNIYLKFVGGDVCAVNTNLNSINGTNYSPTCTITSENAAFNLIWPARDFTVGLPAYPRFSVEPSTDPALNFSNVEFGSTRTLTFSISNTGSQNLTGTISGISAPFSCSPGCGYSINPGVTRQINIIYSPTTSPEMLDKTITFSCLGSTLGCNELTYPTVLMLQRRIIANSVINSVAPSISVWPGSWSIGAFNLGATSPERVFTITNTGGGIMNGEVTFSTTDLTCVGPCTYSILAGQSTTIRVRYTPTTAGLKSESITFTGGSGISIPVTANVNDLPILRFFPGSTQTATLNYQTTFGLINVGSCRDLTVQFRNTGSGTLTGSITGVPIAGAPTDQIPGFSCMSGCTYANIPNDGLSRNATFRFCPVDDQPASASAQLSNVDNPSQGGTISLIGLGNLAPAASTGGITTINFGSVVVGSTNTRTLTITNTGVGALVGTISGLPTGFSCTINCDLNLAAGESTTVTFAFSPTNVQTYSGTITIPGFGGTFSVTGVGVAPEFAAATDGWPSNLCLNVKPGVPGNSGEAMLFRRATDVVSVPHSAALSFSSGAPITISTWIKPNTVGNYGTILIKGRNANSDDTNYAIRNATGGYFEFYYRSGANGWNVWRSSLPVLTSGTWQHVAVTYTFASGGSLVAYVNGVAVPGVWNSGTGGFSPITSTRPLTFGAREAVTLGQEENFVGSIDDARIYNRILSAGEISSIYSGTPSGTGLVGHWTFDDLTVDSNAGIAMDSSGGGNHGRFTPYPCLPPSPKSYDIGTTTYGASAALQNKTFYVYLNNLGTGANVNYSAPDTAHFFCVAGAYGHGCTGAVPLAPSGGASYEALEYEFRPSAPGDYFEPLTISYNDGSGPKTVTIDLSAHSVSAPYLVVTPTANIPLGNVSVGKTATATFTVSNQGTGPMSGSVSLLSTAGAASASGLVSYWPFDTGSMDMSLYRALDMSGGGNYAAIAGPRPVTGRVGNALGFTGYGYLEDTDVSGLSTGNAPHSISMWIKPNGLPSNRSWIGLLGGAAGGNHHLLYRNNGSIQFGVWSGGQFSGPALPVGSWTHMTITYDGSTLRLYYNGVLVGTTPATMNLNSRSFTLGKRGLWNEEEFWGQIDEVRIHNFAMTPAQVLLTYAGAAPTVGQRLYWSLDENNVNFGSYTALDSTGNGNHGTLTRHAGFTQGKIGQAIDLTGTSPYYEQLTSTQSFSNPQSYSLAIWFKTASASGRKMIGFENTRDPVNSTSYDRHIWMGTDGRARFGVYNGSQQIIASTGALNDGNWHLAVATHDSSGNAAFYIDGQLQGTLTAVASNYGGYWRIGGYKISGWSMATDGTFVGSLDEARVYNRPLSATEVSDLYQSGVAGDAGVFRCESGCTFTNLNNGDSQTVQVVFEPADAIGYIGFPFFTSDGGNIGYPAIPYPSITGTGVLDPIIELSTHNLGFPDTNQGLATRRTFQVTNTGFGNLSGFVSPVKAGGLNFYCVQNCSFNLGPTESTDVTIEFSPSVVGALSGTITVDSNAINAPSDTVAVFGNGVFAPIIDIRGGDTNFGNVVINRFRDRTFTITNTGTVDLGSGVFMITGPFTCVDPVDAGDGLCHYDIAAGSSVDITIRFAPVVLGPANGAVWLSGVPLARFFVQGVGVPPATYFKED